MKQLQAGYVLDKITEVFEQESFESISLKKLLQSCNYFNIASRSNFEENEVSYSPVLAILINIIQRGKPTRVNKSY